MKSFKQFLREAKFILGNKTWDGDVEFAKGGFGDPDDPAAIKQPFRPFALSNTGNLIPSTILEPYIGANSKEGADAQHREDVWRKIRGHGKEIPGDPGNVDGWEKVWREHPYGRIGEYLNQELAIDPDHALDHIDKIEKYVHAQHSDENKRSGGRGHTTPTGNHVFDALHEVIVDNDTLRTEHIKEIDPHRKLDELKQSISWVARSREITGEIMNEVGISHNRPTSLPRAPEDDEEDDERFDTSAD